MPREYARLARAMHLLGVISPVTLEAVGGTPVDGASEDPLGFAGPIQILWWRMLARFADALTAAQIPYVYVDGDVGDERIAALRADGLTTLIVPSFELADPDRWARVLAFAEQGGTVVYGPTLPTLDDAMRPADQPEPARGRRVLIDTPEDASRVVAELGLAPTVRVSPAPLEATLHEDREDGAPRVLFVMYPAAVSPRGVTRSIDATVELDAEVALEDAMTGARYGRSRTHRLAIAPGTCRMLLVRHTD